MRSRSMRQVTIWSIGPAAAGSVADLNAYDLPANVRVCELPDWETAKQRLCAVSRVDQGQTAPEVILVWQARPDEGSRSEGAQLLGLAPVARGGRVLDSWCEGEQRSGYPPQGCLTS